MQFMEQSAERYINKISANPEMSHNKILKRLKRGTKVLEFGSASGVMTKIMNQEYGCKVYIVEIDLVCFEKAMKYAEDGICTDIEKLEWIEKFQGQEFDYIICSDVLEHLMQPEIVLKEAKKLLKLEGSILISVPNIAHNSIIIQLLKNQFIYQNTGILDYTHIRHFTYSEIEKLCIETGFSVVYMDGVYISVGRNEFDISYADVDPEIVEFLKRRPFGEVYQHILEIKKAEYIQENFVKIENCLGIRKEYAALVNKTEKIDKDRERTVNDTIVELLCENPNYFFESNEEIARLRTEINEIYLAQPQMEEVVNLQERIYDYQEEVKIKNQHICRILYEIEEKEKRIDELQEEEKSRNRHIEKLDTEIDEKNRYIQEQEKQVEILKLKLQYEERERQQIQEIFEVYQKGEARWEQLQQEFNGFRVQRVSELKAADAEKNQVISDLRLEIENRNKQLQKLEEKLEEQLQQEKQRQEEIQKIENVYREQKEENEKVYHEQYFKIEKLEKELQEIYDAKEKLKGICSELENKNQIYQKTIEGLHLEKEQIYLSFQQQEQIKREMEQQIKNKEGHIELLLESDRELERIKLSRSWKLLSVFWKINEKLFPAGSKRRLCGKLLIRAAKHPVQSVKMVFTPRKLKNFFYYLKKDGAAFVSQRVDESFIGVKVKPEVLVLEQVEKEEGKEIGQYEPLGFNWKEKPMVSIIIPVYNQFEYTYNCLKSILSNSGNVSYEIIIANDGSTDLTVQLTEIVKNIRMINNKENLRFLKNCNHAAKEARGRYLFFLNNDTQVQPNWLQSLTDLMENNSDIGLAGSKLVYADGRLQEAGGILWRDGSAWNYGNRSNSEDPEYNYVKEVDYISGAAIMIRKSLWEEIGGFDERFAPAYCEDSDLAFEVRKHGYKVVYQPLSIVVHYEGISNGTDTGSGQKAYQVVNQKKFLDKWHDVLEKEHFPNAEHVFLARERSRRKPMLLMIDHYVPQYDKDAGSRTVLQYLKMFVHMGYQVKFIGDNFYRHEPYTTLLQQMGIEVLYGSYYANNWKKWIKENGSYISFVFLNRPHISVKYIDYIKTQTNAKIIYYGHDLHFLREMRKYELTKDKKALADSKDWKEKELKLMRQADVVYYPSEIEVNEIAKIDPMIHAKAIVAYIFQDVVPKEYRFEERKDMMFVGGFTHTPNVDAVLWFVKDILPIIKKSIPNIRFTVMGSNPPKEIQNLADESVIVKGFVTDEELEQYYKNCRLSVVPLRYGAGIKGKVVEAMRYGIPVVTTSVGAEGIIGAEEILCIADTKEMLGEKLADLYGNKKKLSEMSFASYRYVQSHFSEENAWKAVEEDFCI